MTIAAGRMKNLWTISVILLFLARGIKNVCVADDAIDVKSLIARKCLSCHHGEEAKGKLDLSTRESIFRGGETGAAIVGNSPQESLLWQRIEQNEMPPKHPLNDAEKRLIKDWISSGSAWNGDALDPLAVSSEYRAGLDWWSLQSIKSVEIPKTQTQSLRHQPIDDFILDKLAKQNLTMSVEVDRRVLIRRISFDLLGLPPTPEEVEQFVQDPNPDAYERVVDRLLGSPHYGERWARHWLDVVRFGESNGFERDLPRPNAWHYRDWVINALNADMPYNEFVRWQLAGDILDEENPDSLKAVGFLVAGAHDTVVPVFDSMRAMMRQDELEDIVGTVGQTFLGLTVNCARCHDHKFDPISTKEYYQLASALSGIDHGEKEFAPAVAEQEVPVEAEHEQESLKSSRTERAKKGSLHIYTAIATQPSAMRIHKRGSVVSLGEEVSPGGIAAVQGLSPDFGLRSNQRESHRRLSLANWVTDQHNPLFIRTMVNRTWHYHFGAGMIESPNDLGFHGGLPSHPELLEWLSGEFKSFSAKRLHHLMVTSAAYRQSSVFNSVAAKMDSNNRFLWRKSPRRLEAEEVRDAMLSIAGQLNSTIGGKGYSDTNSYFFKGTQFYDPIDPAGHENHRRTVYRMWARGGRSPFLDTFDCPDPSTTTPRRSATVTPLQALSLLNHPFSLRMSDRFAERLLSESNGSINKQVQIAYRLLFSRDPDAEEVCLGREFISRRGLSEFCRAMWNSSEFLFVD